MTEKKKKPSKKPKKRASKYEKKLKIYGTFEEVLAVLVKDTIPKKKK